MTLQQVHCALGETSGNVLDSAKAKRLLSAIQPVPVVRTHVRPWSETLIEAITRREALTDYRVGSASRPSSLPRAAGPTRNPRELPRVLPVGPLLRSAGFSRS
jgi:hypothetical protein